MDVGEGGYVDFPLVLNCVHLRTSLVLSIQSKTIVASIRITTKVTVQTLARRKLEVRIAK
jgi:hypothetical protein